MVDVIGRAKVIITGDVDNRSIDQAGGKIGNRLKAGATLGVAALGGLAVAGVKAVVAFEEAESVSRVLNNTLGNMGKSGATEAVEKLADSMQRKTGIDDEVIKKGQTILATFSQVAKSAGEVGGTFERATELSADLAVTGFGSVESGSKALGKALQDPVKGYTLLSRAGVTFTEQQKEQIKAFVETGETAKAQNLILAEVEKQVGGNAEAGAKASAKLKSAVSEANESLGGLIADLFTPQGEGKGKQKSFVELAAEATFKFSDAVKKFQKSQTWKDLRDATQDYAGDLGTVAGALGDIVGYMNSLSKDTTGQGLISFLNDLSKFTTPIRIIASGIRVIQDAAKDNNFSLGDTLIKNIFGGLNPFSFTGRAAGGPASGWTVVGERGPELVNLPNGSYVNSNANSKQMLEGSGRSSNFTVNNYGPVSGSDILDQWKWANRFAPRFGATTASVV